MISKQKKIKKKSQFFIEKYFYRKGKRKMGETKVIVLQTYNKWQNRKNCEVGGAFSPNSVFCHGPTSIFWWFDFPYFVCPTTPKISGIRA